MDDYGQIRLEENPRELHDDLSTIALALHAGQPVRVKVAARMTQYCLVLALAPHVQWVAAEPDKVLGSQLERWLFIGWERHGAGWVRLGDQIDVGDIGQALGNPSVGDHEALVAFAEAITPHLLHRHEWDRTSTEAEGVAMWACLRCDHREPSGLPDGPEDVAYPCR